MKFRDWLLALIGLALMLGSFIVLWTGADSPNGEAFGQAVVWSLWMLAIGFFLLVMGIPSQRRKLKKFEDLLFRQEEN